MASLQNNVIRQILLAIGYTDHNRVLQCPGNSMLPEFNAVFFNVDAGFPLSGCCGWYCSVACELRSTISGLCHTRGPGMPGVNGFPIKRSGELDRVLQCFGNLMFLKFNAVLFKVDVGFPLPGGGG